MQFYFTFPDGMLDYDCARCTALCCRGQGLSAHAERELVPLLRREPGLAVWTTGRNGSIVRFTTPAGRCMFLDPTDRCSIERDSGRELKPSLCRAFPFNRVSVLGDTWVVAPHLLCPMSLRPAKHRDAAGNHERVAAELLADGWVDQPFSKVALHASETPAQWLRAEAELRDACARALESRTPTPIWDELCDDDTRLVTEVAELFGLRTQSSDPNLERHVLALAPVWSSGSARLTARMRRRLVVLARLLVGEALRVGTAPVTLQSCDTFVAQRYGLLELLAQADQPMPEGLLPDSGHADTMLAAALIDQAARKGATILSALRAGCSGLAVTDRYALAQSLAQLAAKRATH